MSDKPQFDLIAHPSIANIAQLRGKKIGFGGIGSLSENIMRQILSQKSEGPALLALAFGVFAARTRGAGNCRPGAFAAADYRFAEHAAHQRAAASAAAGAGADAGAFADLFESFGAGLNRFEHGAFADFVAQASRLEIFNDRLGLGLLLRWIDK